MDAMSVNGKISASIFPMVQAAIPGFAGQSALFLADAVLKGAHIKASRVSGSWHLTKIQEPGQARPVLLCEQIPINALRLQDLPLFLAHRIHSSSARGGDKTTQGESAHTFNVSMDGKAESLWNLPNSLSIARGVSGPVIAALIIQEQWQAALVAVTVSGVRLLLFSIGCMHQGHCVLCAFCCRGQGTLKWPRSSSGHRLAGWLPSPTHAPTVGDGIIPRSSR